jgi:hypothetical protein
LIVVAAALAVAGCGSSGSTTGTGATGAAGATGPTDAEFIAHADAICQAAHTKIAPINAQLKLTSSFQQAGPLFDQEVAIQRRQLAEFKQLDVPADLQAPVASYLAMVETGFGLTGQIRQAINQGDLARVNALKQALKPSARKATAAAGKIGFKVCGQAASDQEQSAAKKAAEQRPQNAQAGVGDTVPLTGSNGLAVNLTLTRVIDPVPAPSYQGAGSGSRYVGIELAFDNKGTKAYDASAPGLSAALITSQDRQLSTSALFGGQCNENNFGTVSPGAKLVGCVAFELPDGVEPKSFQYQPQLIGGGAPVEWSLQGD